MYTGIFISNTKRLYLWHHSDEEASTVAIVSMDGHRVVNVRRPYVTNGTWTYCPHVLQDHLLLF
jgi:hypothetical protein